MRQLISWLTLLIWTGRESYPGSVISSRHRFAPDSYEQAPSSFTVNTMDQLKCLPVVVFFARHKSLLFYYCILPKLSWLSNLKQIICSLLVQYFPVGNRTIFRQTIWLIAFLFIYTAILNRFKHWCPINTSQNLLSQHLV